MGVGLLKSVQMAQLARRVSGALLFALVFGAAACSPISHLGAARSPLLSLPSSTTGKITVSPPDGAADVVPDLPWWSVPRLPAPR